MSARARRALFASLGLGALVLAACAPVVSNPTPTPTTAPPPPVANQLCTSEPAPTASDHVAVVDQGGTRPAVVEFQANTAGQVQQEVAALDATGDVLAVDQDRKVSATATYPAGTNSDYAGGSAAGAQWDMGPSYVNYAGAWNAGTPDIGAGVRVAVVDTGVSASHPDLTGQVVAGKDFVVANQAVSQNGRIDGNGHGTHVAGTIAARDDSADNAGHNIVGGAFGAQVVPVRVLDCAGSGDYQSVANGIIWAADATVNGGGGAKVINLSLGGGVDSSILQSAVKYALNHGVVVVAAAGNGFAGSGPLYPGAYAGDQLNYPGMVAVGATDSVNRFARAAYSNDNPYVTVAAPGSSILSTYAQPSNTYRTLNGTSMATPHVAAVAALVMSKCPADTPSQVLGRIRTGTTPVTGFRNRVVTDGVVGTSTVSSATAAFTAKDVGQTLSGTGIPAGATIQVVVDATTVVLSQAPPAALTGVTLTIGGTPPGMVNAANATAAC